MACHGHGQALRQRAPVGADAPGWALWAGWRGGGRKAGLGPRPMENIEHVSRSVKKRNRFSSRRSATTGRSRPPPSALQRTSLTAGKACLAGVDPLGAPVPNVLVETVLRRRPFRPAAKRLCRLDLAARISTIRGASQAMSGGGAPAAFPGDLSSTNQRLYNDTSASRGSFAGTPAAGKNL